MPADSLQMQVGSLSSPPEWAVPRNADGQFIKGQSGNPAGRVPGTRNRTTMLAEQFLDNQAIGLVQRALELAQDGNVAALKLCIGRIIAPRRHRPSEFVLPPLNSAADLAPALSAVAAAAADGAISTSEAVEFAQIIDTFIRAYEAGEFAARLARLEAVNGIAAE